MIRALNKKYQQKKDEWEFLKIITLLVQPKSWQELQELYHCDYNLVTNLENDEGILWCRDQLVDLGVMQIVGHTRKENIYHDEFSNSVYIDTSAVVGNKLTAVIIENNEIADVLNAKTNPMDIV